MFKCTAIDLDTQPLPTQQRLTCALENARLLADGFCCLSDPLQNQLAMFNQIFYLCGILTFPQTGTDLVKLLE
jgi:hypothetical protein